MQSRNADSRAGATPFDDLAVAVACDEPLARHTWLGLGGEASFFCEPVGVDSLSKLVARCHERGVPLKVIGGGSNLLVPASGFRGMVVRLSAPEFSAIRVEPPCVVAGAGAKLVHVVSAAVQAGLGGLEALVGIPGTLGGALIGNAGGHGGEIGQRIVSVTVMNPDGTIAERKASEVSFQSRWSSLDDAIVLGCRFELDREHTETLTKRMQKQWIVQRAEQPSGTRSVAMMFKDPPGTTAESLVVQSGAKELRVGEATVSEAHANYVVASARCTSDDVRSLVEAVRTRVRDRLGVELTPQIEVW